MCDVDAVRAVGFATWPSTYGPIRGDQYVADRLAEWWTVDAVAGSIDGSSRTYVAEDATGAVVGCAVVGALEGTPMLWKLYVIPAAQRIGAGSALLAAVVADLPPTADRICLDYADGNDSARDFYVKAGFAELHRHGPDNEREVRMERRLR